jgi:hypothetical protein
MDGRMQALIVVALLAIAMAGCQPTGGTGSAQPLFQNPFAPVPGDDRLVRGPAQVDSVQWTAADKTLTFKGSLPTPCNQLRLDFLPVTVEKRLDVNAYSLTKPDEVCAQVIQDFQGKVTLTGVAPGDYTLFVNGQDMLHFSIAS